MDTQTNGVISLIKAAIAGEGVSLPADFDLGLVLDTAKQHQISGMLYHGAVNCGFHETAPAMQTLFAALCRSVIISEMQTKEVDVVCQAFSENGIDHMPLKGTVLRKIYPQAHMRLMSDADILIKTEQYGRIRPIMEALGFSETVESDHDYVWKKSGMVIELHKRLMPSYNKDYFAYYRDGWKLGVLSGEAPHRYTMRPEDQMIYLFTHFAKHYRSGGIGIRHLTDLYIYRKTVGELDEAYIKAELERLGTYDFYINILETVNVWFGDGTPNEKTDFITDTIFQSGAYGQAPRRKIAETVLLKRNRSLIKSEKQQYMLRMLFPNMNNMTFHYSFLKKVPFLLPVMWIVRLFRIALFKREKARSFYAYMENISARDISDYKEELRYVGLEFDFEEKLS